MAAAHPADEGLTELRDLNRLFLNFVRTHVSRGSSVLGLPAPTAEKLAGLDNSTVERLAGYPQAMFRFGFDVLGSRHVQDAGEQAVDGALRMVQGMLLYGARKLAREHAYAARLYLRLEPAQVRSLRDLAITDLDMLARREGAVHSAYRTGSWMWSALLCSEPADDRRALILLGLQPSVELNPPRHRR